jgi:hypothetical protein
MRASGTSAHGHHLPIAERPPAGSEHSNFAVVVLQRRVTWRGLTRKFPFIRIAGRSQSIPDREGDVSARRTSLRGGYLFGSGCRTVGPETAAVNRKDDGIRSIPINGRIRCIANPIQDRAVRSRSVLLRHRGWSRGSRRCGEEKGQRDKSCRQEFDWSRHGYYRNYSNARAANRPAGNWHSQASRRVEARNSPRPRGVSCSTALTGRV